MFKIQIYTAWWSSSSSKIYQIYWAIQWEEIVRVHEGEEGSWEPLTHIHTYREEYTNWQDSFKIGATRPAIMSGGLV